MKNIPIKEQTRFTHAPFDPTTLLPSSNRQYNLQWLDQTPPPQDMYISPLPGTLLKCLTEQPSYEELSQLFSKLGSEATDYISSLRHYRLDIDQHIPPGSPLNHETTQYLMGPLSDQLISQAKVKSKNETIQ